MIYEFQSPLFAPFHKKKHTKLENLYYLVGFVNSTKPGTALIETILSGDPPVFRYSVSIVTEVWEIKGRKGFKMSSGALQDQVIFYNKSSILYT